MGHGCVQVPGCVEGDPWNYHRFSLLLIALAARKPLDNSTTVFIQESEFENVGCKLSGILFNAQCVELYPGVIFFLIRFMGTMNKKIIHHDDVIKWKHFLRYWPFVRGIHRSPVNSPHKGQWRRALMFSYLRLNKRLNKQSRRCDLRRHQAHYEVTVMARPICRNTKHEAGISILPEYTLPWI